MHYVLIAGDHSMVRFGLSVLIREILPGAIIEETGHAEEMMERVRSTPYGLIVLDCDMPGIGPAAVMRQIASGVPGACVVVTGRDAEEGAGRRYLELGAHGYVPKGAPEDEVRQVLTRVLERSPYSGASHSNAYNPFEKLSPRESEIILLLLNGKSYTEISRLLNVQYTTVRTHKQRIFEKLNIQEGAELLQLTLQYPLPELSHS